MLDEIDNGFMILFRIKDHQNIPRHRVGGDALHPMLFDKLLLQPMSSELKTPLRPSTKNLPLPARVGVYGLYHDVFALLIKRANIKEFAPPWK